MEKKSKCLLKEQIERSYIHIFKNYKEGYEINNWQNVIS